MLMMVSEIATSFVDLVFHDFITCGRNESDTNPPASNHNNSISCIRHIKKYKRIPYYIYRTTFHTDPTYKYMLERLYCWSECFTDIFSFLESILPFRFFIKQDFAYLM